MNPSITIHQIDLESFDSALNLLECFFREEGFDTLADEMRASLRAILTCPDNAVFLAWHGAEAIGVVTVSTSLSVEYGRCAEIDDLYVLPLVRQQGVAAALIEAATAWCRQQGCTVALVTVTPAGDTMHGLVGFYQRRGFVHTGRVILTYSLKD